MVRIERMPCSAPARDAGFDVAGGLTQGSLPGSHCTSEMRLSCNCSWMNQACFSLVRITSLTSRSLVPSSPSSLAPRRRSCAQENALMGVDKPCELDRRVLAILRRAREPCRFGDIGRHRDRDSAKGLDSFRDLVDQRQLLFMVLVEKQVQLVERRTRRLPMVLLVEIAQGHRVGKHLIQCRDVLRPCLSSDGDARVGEFIERLRRRRALFAAGHFDRLGGCRNARVAAHWGNFRRP